MTPDATLVVKRLRAAVEYVRKWGGQPSITTVELTNAADEIERQAAVIHNLTTSQAEYIRQLSAERDALLARVTPPRGILPSQIREIAERAGRNGSPAAAHLVQHAFLPSEAPEVGLIELSVSRDDGTEAEYEIPPGSLSAARRQERGAL